MKSRQGVRYRSYSKSTLRNHRGKEKEIFSSFPSCLARDYIPTWPGFSYAGESQVKFQLVALHHSWASSTAGRDNGGSLSGLSCSKPRIIRHLPGLQLVSFQRSFWTSSICLAPCAASPAAPQPRHLEPGGKKSNKTSVFQGKTLAQGGGEAGHRTGRYSGPSTAYLPQRPEEQGRAAR